MRYERGRRKTPQSVNECPRVNFFARLLTVTPVNGVTSNAQVLRGFRALGLRAFLESTVNIYPIIH